ncbi:DUF803-domain-containing protein [Clavulina sp. PMI_390]|nr:DUF803-domain-containing protein [Clavulina sp. PMI_390]
MSSSSISTPPQYHAVGVALAIGSGALIGSSFVFKKRGLLAAQGDNLGEGVAYLKNMVWWTGMIMMILGELCNFGAYAFVAAIIVTPMGALSVVICAILSTFFLNERLTLIGWIGCFQCIFGAVIIALNAPDQQSVNTIAEFKHLFLAPGFLAYGGVVIVSVLILIFFFAPRYGKKNMLWQANFSMDASLGGLSVSCTQGLGACIVTTIRGENQFKNWFIYFLIAFVAVTLVTEIYFLNMALALFNTAMVTPVYFTLFTTCTLVTSLVLYQGVKASPKQIVTVFLGFLVISKLSLFLPHAFLLPRLALMFPAPTPILRLMCFVAFDSLFPWFPTSPVDITGSGVSLLQLSKVDPSHLRNLDRRTTILLQAAREEVKADDLVEDGDVEKGIIAATEEPGIDAMRGTFGGLGTITRAKRRQSIVSGGDRSSHYRSSVATSAAGGNGFTASGDRRRRRRDTVASTDLQDNLAGRGVRRFQLHDAPPTRSHSATSPTTPVSQQNHGPPPPSSFLSPGSFLGRRKRRDSHDSAAAQQGSDAGDSPSSPTSAKMARGGSSNSNAAVASPSPPNGVNGIPKGGKFASKESLTLKDVQEDAEDGENVVGVDVESELSMHTLLAQQQWAAERRLSAAGHTDNDPSPLRHQTTIQFAEPTLLSQAHAHRHREHGPGDNIPPIQVSQSSIASTSPSTAAPAVLDGILRRPDLAPAESAASGVSGSAASGLSIDRENGRFFSSPSPIGSSPAETPGAAEATSIDGQQQQPFPLRRGPSGTAASRFGRHMLESHEEVTEPTSSTTGDGDDRAPSPAGQIAAQTRSRPSTPSRSLPRSRPTSPSPLQAQVQSRSSPLPQSRSTSPSHAAVTAASFTPPHTPPRSNPDAVRTSVVSDEGPDEY